MRPPGKEILRSEDTEVAHSSRKPMDKSERAKQFMPFAALKGLPEALAAKEKQVVEEKERLGKSKDGRGEEICDTD